MTLPIDGLAGILALLTALIAAGGLLTRGRSKAIADDYKALAESAKERASEAEARVVALTAKVETLEGQLKALTDIVTARAEIQEVAHRLASIELVGTERHAEVVRLLDRPRPRPRKATT